MITVGIQDNIRITAAAVNEKGTLVISLQQGEAASSLLEELSSSSTQTSEREQDIYLWEIKEDERLTSSAEKVKDVLNKLKGFRAQLNHFLEQFMTSDKIHWTPTKNLGLQDDAELTSGLMDDTKRPVIVAGIYHNYITQFVAAINPHIGMNSPFLRMKLQRTSKDKNFPIFPRFVPFIEPMTISKTASQLKWSDYDKGKRGTELPGHYSGVNVSDASQTEGAGAGAAKAKPAEMSATKSLFGGN
jgi:hypothetical protein